MARWLSVDWEKIFTPTTPVFEIFLRGSVIYLALFVVLRLIRRRETGTLSLTNLLVVVLLGSAVQNGLAGNYVSVTDGILLIVPIVFWSYLLDWLGFHYPRLQRLLHPPPLPLVERGAIQWQNMRREFITKDELMDVLREQGVDDLARVKTACLEANGRISVITFDADEMPRKNAEMAAS